MSALRASVYPITLCVLTALFSATLSVYLYTHAYDPVVTV